VETLCKRLIRPLSSRFLRSDERTEFDLRRWVTRQGITRRKLIEPMRPRAVRAGPPRHRTHRTIDFPCLKKLTANSVRMLVRTNKGGYLDERPEECP
jgi:hypothetical protein